MKKILTLLLLVVVAITSYAQTPPEAFNYSAVARDVNGFPIANASIGIQITLKQGSPNGATVYEENHIVNTDDFGLFNLIVGGGSILSGTIADIDWSADDYYLQVGMDANGGTNFLNMGSTQLLSVPYALYAKSAGSAGGIQISSVSTDGDTLYLSNGQTFVNGSNGGQNGGLVNPTVTTDVPTDITSNSATLGGTISNANGNQIILRGVVYSTSPNPTIILSDSIVVGSGIGSFNINALDVPGEDYHYEYLLNANTTYYVRAFAVTENNTVVYGNEVSFATLAIGQIGPGGGRVFFDKGNNSGGWQYLEAAPTDQSTGSAWGCETVFVGGTSTEIGAGPTNTYYIISTCNGAAAQLCNDLTLGGQSDWVLPSISEMTLMRQNLFLNNLGGFNANYAYWSSTQYINTYYAFAYYFSGAGSDAISKNNPLYVRAVRAF